MTVAGALKKESQDPSGPCSNVVDDELQVNQTLLPNILIDSAKTVDDIVCSSLESADEYSQRQGVRFSSLVAYQARTIYLFTCDNHQIIVLPWTGAGIADALSGSALTTNHAPSFRTIAFRLPHALLWMWLNILAFAITNQRSPRSVTEDSVNKPWRPIPSGRLSTLQAQNLLLALVPLILLITTYSGAGSTTAVAFVLNWMYNDLGGSDVHYTIRNLINALAMIVASTGTTRVAMYDGSNLHDFSATGYQWLAIKATIVFTTLQIQDLRDQDGDRSRCRNTAPIALGDQFTRWTIAGPVMFWSTICPFFWNVDFFGYIVPLILGIILSMRILAWRSIEADQSTWKLWGLWTFSIFLLPLYRFSLLSLV